MICKLLEWLGSHPSPQILER